MIKSISPILIKTLESRDIPSIYSDPGYYHRVHKVYAQKAITATLIKFGIPVSTARYHANKVAGKGTIREQFAHAAKSLHLDLELGRRIT